MARSYSRTGAANKLSRFISQRKLLRKGDRVVIGVSGGADSMCLLDLLDVLRGGSGLKLRVVHVHHGLREAADEEAAFVESECAERGIPCRTVRVDVRAYSRANSCGTEEAARILRLEALEEAAGEWDREEKDGRTARIALAHHLEDQAETVLFRLARGTSLRGLAGMEAENGRIIRPMLCLTRKEIEEHLKEQGLSWKEDESNASEEYARNRIRHKVLPLLAETVNEQAACHIAEAAEDVRRAENYLDSQAARRMKACRDADGSCVIPKLLRSDPALLGRMLRQVICDAAGSEKDVGRIHVEELEALCRKKGNGRISLPYGLTAVKSYDRLFIRKEEAGGGSEPGTPAVPAEIPGAQAGPFSREEYDVEILERPRGKLSLPASEYTKWFDYDKILSLLQFRTRRRGDRITTADDGSGKSLADFMIDRKIPAPLRDRFILPFAGREVLWVPEYRRSELYKVTDRTKRILSITWNPDRR